MKDLTLRSKTGGVITVQSDSDFGTYLTWKAGAGYLLGTAENTEETRTFLRAALTRMENTK